jgi:penicillin-binding protein 1C
MRSLLFLLILGACGKMPSSQVVKKDTASSFLVVKDNAGEVIHETRINFKKHRREWIPLSQMGDEILKDVVRFEDKRFREHKGVDPLALIGAVCDFPRRGGSTITMQLAKILGGKKAKLLQMNDAILIEQTWSKNEILEAYLNLVSFRGELEGVMAGSLGVFNKDPRALSKEERSILLAMIPAPSQNEDALFTRACAYFGEKYCGNVRELIHTVYLRGPQSELRNNLAPHVANKFRSEKVTVAETTLSRDLQEKTSELLQGHLALLKKQNVSDGAVLVVERKTGKIRAYVGSSGELSQSPHVDHVQSLRQAGSTLKPLLYADAIARKLITMSTKLKDEPFTITKEGLTYQPENYQKSFTLKDVPAKVALGSSLNIPAIRVIDYLTPVAFHSLLSDLEMRKLAEPDFYGHSMALGSVDVTLWDLVRAYTTLANGGEFRELTLRDEKPVTKMIPSFNPEVSWIISHILSEKENRHLTFGIQSSLSTDSWSAVKTGTSKDMRDNWCIGYTDTYVIGVWVGNSSGDSMWNVTGISGAAPLFSQLVTILHENSPSKAPERPATLVEKNGDYYLPGTEPLSSDLAITKNEVRKIIFPQNGAQFAFDPEIPKNKQRILFTASSEKAIWKINGKVLSADEKKNGFFPEKKGKYKLELWEDQLLDEVTFFVKAGKTKVR